MLKDARRGRGMFGGVVACELNVVAAAYLRCGIPHQSDIGV